MKCFQLVFGAIVLAVAATAWSSLAPKSHSSALTSLAAGSKRPKDGGYVPEGLTSKQYEDIKAHDAEKHRRKDLGRVGTIKFESRSMRSFIADGLPHLFPVDPKTVKRGEADIADLPYMQRRAGAWDNSDLAGKIPGLQRKKWLSYDKQYAAWAEKAAQSVNLYGTARNMPWTGAKSADPEHADPPPMAKRLPQRHSSRPRVAAVLIPQQPRMPPQPQEHSTVKHLLETNTLHAGHSYHRNLFLSLLTAVVAGAATGLKAHSNMPPAVKAPNFRLPGADNQLHSLTELCNVAELDTLVLFFFPGAQRSAAHTRCTQEVQNFENHAAAYSTLHARVVGISADSLQRMQTDFPALKHVLLLSDAGAQVAKTFGTANEGGTYANRATYVISARNGSILHSFKDVENDVQKHSDQVLTYLSSRSN